MQIAPNPGDIVWRISGSGVVRYFCEMTVLRVTPKQVVVKTPRGHEERYYLKDGRGVGNPGSWLRVKAPEEGPCMKMSAEMRR